MELKVKKLQPDAILPVYGSKGAACFDLHAYLPEGIAELSVANGMPLVVPTALAFEIPTGWAMEIYSRSGHGFKSDIRLANCVGIIDHDYTGEVMVKLASDAESHIGFVVRHGDRVAQAKLVPAPQVTFVEVDELHVTERGGKGFGSTGQ